MSFEGVTKMEVDPEIPHTDPMEPMKVDEEKETVANVHDNEATKKQPEEEKPPEPMDVSEDIQLSCQLSPRLPEVSPTDLAGYLDELLHIPKELSEMAQAMYS